MQKFLIMFIFISFFQSRAEVVFSRDNEILEDKKFEQKLSEQLMKKRGFISKQYGKMQQKFTIDNKDIKNHLCHNYSLNIKNINKISKNFTAFLIPESSEKEQIRFHGKYEEFLEVPVLRFAASVGSLITHSDLIKAYVPLKYIKKSTLQTEEEIVGNTARGNLRPSLPINESDILRPQLVRKKDQVTIFYDDKSLSLKALGIALEGGAKGESVKVKNAQTNIVINGVIEGPQTIRVRP